MSHFLNKFEAFFALFQEMLESSVSGCSCLQGDLLRVRWTWNWQCSLSSASRHFFKKTRSLCLLQMPTTKNLSNIWSYCLINWNIYAFFSSAQRFTSIFKMLSFKMSKLCKMPEEIWQLELLFQTYFLYHASELFCNHIWITIYFYSNMFYSISNCFRQISLQI